MCTYAGDSHNKWKLFDAVEKNDEESCYKWLNKIDDKRATDDDGRTALHMAARKGHLSISQLLLESGLWYFESTSLDDDRFKIGLDYVRDNDGKTPIDYVAKNTDLHNMLKWYQCSS